MPGIVRVENLKTYKGRGTYIGRTRDPQGSAFGNPYTHLPLDRTQAKWQVKTREESIERYRDWVRQRYKEDEFFYHALNNMVIDYLKGREIILVCHCAPEPCHGDVLKELIEEMAEFRVVSLERPVTPYEEFLWSL